VIKHINRTKFSSSTLTCTLGNRFGPENEPSKGATVNQSIEEQVVQFIMKTFHDRSALRPFALQSQSVTALAKYYLIFGTESSQTLKQYVSWVHKFCQRNQITPDQLICLCLNSEGSQNAGGTARVRRMVDNYVMELRVKGLARATLSNFVESVKSLLHVNGVCFEMPMHYSKVSVCYYRAPTVEEIQRLLAIARPREKVMVSMIAAGGLRPSTLARLRYKDVKNDLEQGIIPVKVEVSPLLTKGKYCGFCTFLNQEAAEYLRDYLEKRRAGNKRVSPESISDNSPILRRRHSKRILPVSEQIIQTSIKNLLGDAGLLVKPLGQRRFDLSPYSFRKFFRTQMAVLGVENHYIEYMMGHKCDRYLDVKMVGTEYVRRVYDLSGISIQNTRETDEYRLLCRTIEKLGYRTEEVLKEEFRRSHGNVC
jgi:integrase